MPGRFRRTVAAATFIAMIAPAPVLAAPRADVTDLAAGRHLWLETAAEASRAPDVVVFISIADQAAYVYRGGALIGATSVSTGRAGHETPTGSFTILQKRPFHRSNLYSNAPMPFMQRLTWDGIAIHAGALPGYPASHGCIRMPRAFAQRLFALTELGANVHIVADAIPDPYRMPFVPAPPIAPDASVLEGHGYNVVTARGVPRPPVPMLPVAVPPSD